MPKLPCHYCGEPSHGKDHIVARAWIRVRNLPMEVAVVNKVPACNRCNGAKSHFRSDCVCFVCEQAWVILAPYIKPRIKSDIEVFPLLERLREGVL